MSYIQTFIFGITLAISIGPIAILILNQGINCGLRNGVLCGLGAATADLTYAIVAFTTGGLLISLIENQKEIIPIVSSAVLVIFSIWMIYTTFKKKSSEKKGKYSLTCKYPFVITYGLTITNPLTIVVFAGFAGLLTSDGEANIFLHALIIFIASLLVQMLIAFAGSKLAAFFSRPKTLLYFNLASAFGIMLLGISKLL
jgi:threonine/homoserine/homoserine lactone efflux protein